MTSPTSNSDAVADLLGTLPEGWSAAEPLGHDSDELHALQRRHELAARGGVGVTLEAVDAVVTADETHRHLAVRDADGAVRGWATAHDRAAGRVLAAVVVDPDLDAAHADALAAGLFTWTAETGVELARSRGLAGTQIDSGAFADDARQHRWLEAAGFTRTRRWWQMSRPVEPGDETLDETAQRHPSVVVRRVRRGADGMPEHDDLVAVHEVLEEAFADHFNHHREELDEFLTRLRLDPGHRWDHWWLAEVVEDGTTRPAGALVGAESRSESGTVSSYVEYLGVLRTARGRGVATSLLHAIIADAARRGRTGVGLEVDADSSTGADRLYASLGFRTSYETESWHRDVPA